MKVNIDRNGCISCGACWTSCPDFFEQSPDDDRSRIMAAYRAGSEGEGTVPKDQEDCVEGAVDACPVQVIHLS